jgi:hypothetical protein
MALLKMIRLLTITQDIKYVNKIAIPRDNGRKYDLYVDNKLVKSNVKSVPLDFLVKQR